MLYDIYHFETSSLPLSADDLLDMPDDIRNAILAYEGDDHA